MLLWITAAALAGVTGKVAGQPFEAASALAGPGTEPGTVTILLSDLPAGCGAMPAEHPSLLMLTFDAVAGATISRASLSTPKTPLADAQAMATLTAIPTEVGATGHLAISSLTAKKTSVAGEIDFTVCEAIALSAPPTATFAPKQLTFGDGDDKMVFEVPVPDWPSEVDFSGRTVWKAPDGVTKFWVDATCDGACDPKEWADNAKGHTARQLSNYASTPGYVAKTYRDESPRAGLQISQFGYGATGSALSVTLDVLAWGDDWPQMAQCHVETIEKYASFLDEAEKACAAITRVP